MSLIGAVALLPEARVQTLLNDPSAVYAAIDSAYNDPAAGFVDLDKAWHCLHYLLTGSAWGGDDPLNFLVRGGCPLLTEAASDVAAERHGPPRVFRPLELAAVADALAPLDASTLLLRFDANKLEQLGIYPGGFAELDLRSDYDLGYYLGPFEELKKVTARGKAERAGMLVWVA
jgi:hypothetical protein